MKAARISEADGRRPPLALLGPPPISGKSGSPIEEDFSREPEPKSEGKLPGWDGIQDRMLRASCAFFASEVLTGPPQPPYSGKFILGNHHLEWDQLVAKYPRICVLASRDHGKTFFWSFAYPLWRAMQLERGSGFIFSATQPQAGRILDDIRTELENNPQLHYLLPRGRETWSGTTLKLSNGHRIYARGFGTRVRGAHPNWIVVDDALNDETMYSEMVRSKEIDYFYTAITNMIVPGGQIIVVGTPFHSEDLYADLQKNLEYTSRKYPALKPDGTALWPERYSLALLQKRKAEIGSVRFTREFQVDPISDEMSLFPLALFRGAPVEQPMAVLGKPRSYWEALGVSQFFTGVDFAMSSSVQADYTVIWTVGLDRWGNRWIVDIRREKGLPYQQQLSLINEVGRLYNSALIYLESNQMQKIFGDELIRTTDLPIKEFVTGVQKNSIDKGVPSLRVLLENKKFRIPRGDKHSVEMTDFWIEEMRNFTWSEGKLQSVGGHDDTVMACWICDQAVRHGAFSFTFGDSYESLDEGGKKALLAELVGEESEEEKKEREAEERGKKKAGAFVLGEAPKGPEPVKKPLVPNLLSEEDAMLPGLPGDDPME